MQTCEGKKICSMSTQHLCHCHWLLLLTKKKEAMTGVGLT